MDNWKILNGRMEVIYDIIFKIIQCNYVTIEERIEFPTYKREN